MNNRNYEATLSEWIEKCTGRDNSIADRPGEAYANFIPLTNNAKIKICDSIIELARQVFGPYGGYWIKKIGAKNNPAVSNEYVIKSKDGNEFFKQMTFLNEYAQVFLLSIQGYTKYIADARTEDINQTSKDGTTSTALLSAAFAKFLLIELELMKSRGENHRLPSTMYNLIFDVLLACGSRLIKEHAVKVYDEASSNYLEGMEKYALHAVNTTIDSNPVLSNCFTNFVDMCKTNRINILNVSREIAPKMIFGAPKVEIELVSGVKFAALKIDALPITQFKFENQPVFIFDGYIEDGHVSIFIEELGRYLTAFAESPAFRPDITPIILLTRTPDKLIHSLAKFTKIGQMVTLTDPNTGKKNPQPFYIKPVFFQMMNEFENAEHSKTIKEIFKNNIVDLNAINNYILQQRLEENMYDESGAEVEFKSSKEHVSLQAFFPNITTSGVLQNARYTLDRTQSIKKGEKTYHPVTFELTENNGCFAYVVDESTMDELFANVSFEGSFIRVDSQHSNIQSRITSARTELIELRDRLNESLTPMSGLDERIEMLTASTIRPVVYYQTESQQSQLVTLYNDALGVFASVHKDGVMPGANTFFLKCFDYFVADVNKHVAEMLQNVPEDKKNLYIMHTEAILRAMYNAYAYVYSFIDNNQQHLEDYKRLWETRDGSKPEDFPDILTIYNAVSGRWEESIIEPACTTKDVFGAMLNIAQDFVLINSIQINSKYDQSDAIQEKITQTYHPINLKYAPIADQEKYKNLKID